jgi:regulator of sigma E protease
MDGAIQSIIGPFFFAVITFVPLLLVLVVVHELGHYLTGRAFGVKVLEFGIGYPPKAFGLYTGSTRVLTDQDTALINLERLSELRPRQLVRISSTEDQYGNLLARIIEAPGPNSGRSGPQSLQELGSDEYLRHEGRVRDVGENSLVVADMLYSLNWLPLGGFVRLAGESNPRVPRSLASKGTGQRAIVLAAGSFMNAILPIIIFTILFMVPQDVKVGDVVVTEVSAQSPAATSGVQPGDIITRANDKAIENRSDLVRVTTMNRGSEMEWLINREGREEIIYVTPRMNPPEGEGATGVGIDLINVRIEREFYPPWTALARSVSNTWQMLVLLKQEVFAWIGGQRSPELSGPIGIAQITGEVTREGGLRGWLVLAILFSINLAILNILPIPMLDGGRLVFVILEWLRRGKRVPPEKEGLVHLIGFVMLIGLIILISAKDIQRLIQGGSPLGG